MASFPPDAARLRTRIPALLTAVVLGAVILAACAGASRKVGAPVDRPLTEDQAVQLASTLYRDYMSEGAHVDVQVPYSAKTTVGITGDVDFRDHTGHLIVFTATTGDAPTTQDVDYTASAVYEATAAPAVPGGVGWTMRAPDPADRPIDRIIQLIVALASPQRDNPLLVAQSQARFTGQRSFTGITVNVYRYSPAIVYWVGADDGLLYRFIGNVQGISGPVTIDITERGPHPTPAPPQSDIVGD
jgi:hypothetical protein